jgi:hypothetical protein
MATVTKTGNVVLCSTPFLIRKISCTGGTTGADITHGESRSPDIIFVNQTDAATPAHTGIGVVVKDADELSVDCVVDSADTFDIYCIWLTQASAGLAAS